jgi:phage shock protein C
MSQPVIPQETPEIETSALRDSTGGEYLPPSGQRLLRRSKKDRIIGGVCGGIARYFGGDALLFRIAFLVLLVPGGLGLLLYLIAWIAIPEFKTEAEEVRDTINHPVDRRTAGSVAGAVLVIAGTLILLDRFVDWFDPRVIGGAALIIIGAFIIMRGLRSEA